MMCKLFDCFVIPKLTPVDREPDLKLRHIMFDRINEVKSIEVRRPRSAMAVNAAAVWNANKNVLDRAGECGDKPALLIKKGNLACALVKKAHHGPAGQAMDFQR